MCGRFSLFPPPWFVEDRFEATFASPYERRYNAAPGQALLVITDERPDRIQTATWGLVPPWAEERSSDSTPINARAETVADAASFRDSFAGVSGEPGTDEPAAGRCLVLADGFYEWSEAGQPYRVARTDGEPFAMAGLWTRVRPAGTQTGLDRFGTDGPATSADEGDETADTEPGTRSTFAIVTTAANEVVAAVHDRMPVMLPPETERRWLTGDAGVAGELLQPSPSSTIETYPVSRAVNDASNDSPAVLAGIDGP